MQNFNEIPIKYLGNGMNTIKILVQSQSAAPSHSGKHFWLFFCRLDSFIQQIITVQRHSKIQIYFM